MRRDTEPESGGMSAPDMPYKWIEDGDARWHRVADVSSGAATTLCGWTLDETPATRWEPPPEPAHRCRSCEIEGEGAPPNH